jgi:hypothetical protein
MKVSSEGEASRKETREILKNFRFRNLLGKIGVLN